MFKKMIAISALMIALTIPTIASAHDSFRFSLNLAPSAPYYVEPAPVYTQPVYPAPTYAYPQQYPCRDYSRFVIDRYGYEHLVVTRTCLGTDGVWYDMHQ